MISYKVPHYYLVWGELRLVTLITSNRFEYCSVGSTTPQNFLVSSSDIDYDTILKDIDDLSMLEKIIYGVI